MRIVRFIAKLVAAVLLLILLFGGWMWWDSHRIVRLCASITPGTSIARLKSLADDDGLGRWVERASADEAQPGQWKVFFPVPSTFGEVGCEVTHDGGAVIFAKME